MPVSSSNNFCVRSANGFFAVRCCMNPGPLVFCFWKSSPLISATSKSSSFGLTWWFFPKVSWFQVFSFSALGFWCWFRLWLWFVGGLGLVPGLSFPSLLEFLSLPPPACSLFFLKSSLSLGKTIPFLKTKSKYPSLPTSLLFLIFWISPWQTLYLSSKTSIYFTVKLA